MIQFIKGVFTDSDGMPSSKRVVMFILLIVFVTVTISNLYWGKLLNQSILDQLDFALIYTISAVFGEKVTDIWKSFKQPRDAA